MNKTFNELFDEFFKRNNIKPEDKINDNIKDNAMKMIDMLTNFKEVPKIDENQELEMDEKLGKPDKIEFFNEGDVFFERRIWHTPKGDIEKLIFSNDPTLIVKPVEVSLQEKLEIAVSEEDFEQAAIIRDEMKKKKKIIKKTK